MVHLLHQHLDLLFVRLHSAEFERLTGLAISKGLQRIREVLLCALEEEVNVDAVLNVG